MGEGGEKMERGVFDWVEKGRDREERVREKNMGEVEEMVVIRVDEGYVMLEESDVRDFELWSRWSVMGGEDDGSVGMEMEKWKGDDFKGMVDGSWRRGGESRDMGSVVRGVGDVGGMDGYRE